ncbi:cache domain-containing sensor histidine kinase [Paenibacillus eucommiae]|uniref:Two-component system sensor histidine kinase YesM n=1 Tax=Paenibacillus eucommiae TaxID=1355755 RepID=A0ABS4J7Z7_9BACL|nr:histidine kinase [Paenibacillus eucommiae]MBP1995976.1 two-component system sensor histidine kinase YesM [Paenibacillus eucommiae]
MATRKSLQLSLRQKLIFASVLCLILPAFLTLLVSNYFTKDIIRTQIIQNEKKSLEQADLYISNLFSTLTYISNYIQFDSDINLTLKEVWQRSKLGQTDPLSSVSEFRKITEKLTNIAIVTQKQYVTILTSKGRYFTNYSPLGFDPASFLNEPWMEQVRKQPAFDLYWAGALPNYIPSEQAGSPYLITMAKALKISSEASYAYVIISISEKQVSQIFDHDKGRQETLLIDREGRVVASKDNQKIGKQFAFSAELEKLDESAAKLIRSGREEFLLSSHDLAYNGYRIVSLTPYKEAVNQINSISRLSFLFQIVLMVVFLFVFIYMVRQFTKPVVQLGRVVSRVEGGDLGVRSGITGHDEIGRLGQSFDQMLERIERMIRQITNEQTQKRKAELAMLQAQINPHFLFNILNSIRLRILLRGDQENADLLSALSGLLRMTIQRHNEYTPLHEELHIVQKYVELLNFRQADEVKLDIQATSDSMPVIVPRFLLQPLIENAYIHGLSQNGGVIGIFTRRTEEQVSIIVEDDGQGMSPEMLELLRMEMRKLGGLADEKESTKRLSRIGIANIYERLYLLYGADFQLLIDSTPQQGTRIELIFPVEAPDSVRGGEV